MHRFVLPALALCLLGSAALRADETGGKLSAKHALEALNDYIGDWHGSGSPQDARADARAIWREAASWTWRFKSDDAWLVLKITDGKHFKGGELRYVPDKKRYRLKLTTADGKTQVFEGRIRKDVLTLDRLDAKSHETQRLRMNLAADGARFVYRYEYRPHGRTVFYRGYQVGFTKEGESLGASESKVECVVTGGLGKIPVTYNGQTYYVCCSGCLEAFNENPAKYIKEYEKRKARKK